MPMRWSDIQFTPSKKTLRQFAGLGVVFFGGAALWQAFIRGHNGLATSLGGLAALFGVAGLAQPESLRLIYIGWMILAFPIGWTVSLLMLIVIYYGLFTPIGILFRLIGRDALDRTKHAGATSYWVPKPAPDKLGRYFKQF
jgi:Saxitoxin biosynthesis operon protein SxtJ